jgi:hypothetical protein
MESILDHFRVEVVEVFVWNCVFDHDEAVFVETSDGFFEISGSEATA